MARDKDRRNKILRTAAQVFLEQGYKSASMNLIAERADVTKPGLYYHFKSKRELLFSIMSYAMSLLEQATREATQVASSNEERLRELIFRHAKMIAEEDDGAFTLLVIDLVDQLDPDDGQLITQRKRAYFELVKEVLEQLKEEGKLRDLHATVATFSLLGMVMWIAKWFRQAGPLTDRDVAGQITEMALAAVLRDDRRATCDQ